MAVTLPLHEMTIAEKLRVMEILWEDLSRNADSIPSPDWHGAVLQEREEKIASGKASFSDWETAKSEIRQRLA